MERNTINNSALNILVIGTGMYVCGRGTNSYGTVLPAIYEWKRHVGSVNVYITGASSEGINAIKKKIEELNNLFGFSIIPKYYCKNTANHEAYIDAICDIPKPACAIVVVPDNLHREIAGSAIANGLHTLVAKPLAPTLNEVVELIELQKRNNVYCAVEFHKRFDSSNIKLKDTIESGSIGDILYFIVEYSQRKSIPTERFPKWVESTNIFQYLGIHYVDIIYFSTKAVPQRVMAIGQKNWLFQQGIDTYDSIQVIVEWKMSSGNIFTASFFTSWIDPEKTSAMSDQRIKVIGTKGRYEADQKMRGICLVTDEKGIEEPNPDFCSIYGSKAGEITFQGYGIDSVVQFLDDVREIETGILKMKDLETKRPTFKESVVPTIVIEAANRSLKENGTWVNTSELMPHTIQKIS